MSSFQSGFLRDLAEIRDAKTCRVSSWDYSGRNQDYWLIPPHESVVLAEIEGPGCITHLWMTQFCRELLGPSVVDPVLGSQVAPVNEIHNALGTTWERADADYYRKVLLKIYWDDQEQPSVLTPLGDFFCVGHSMPGNFASLPFTVSAKPEEANRFGGSASLNCYIPMPFNGKARIVVENQNDLPYGQYFHIDFELYQEKLPEQTGYLHASWRRENPCLGWGADLQVNTPEVNNATNEDGKENYLILETSGEGHYIGCNLSVRHFQGSWWGEGDDMIFVDEDTWPPSIHGTGSEDYFNHAWGMQKNAFPMHGSIVHESDVPGYQVSYRFHLTDPVHFKKRIRVTMEHGHANHLSDDWASTAYWYQKLNGITPRIQPVEERTVVGRAPAFFGPIISMTPEQVRLREEFAARGKAYIDKKFELYEVKFKKTRESSQRNIQFAQGLRKAFDA